jgi:hypothetical protein
MVVLVFQCCSKILFKVMLLSLIAGKEVEEEVTVYNSKEYFLTEMRCLSKELEKMKENIITIQILSWIDSNHYHATHHYWV